MLTNQNSWDGYWSQGSTENRFQLPEEPEFFKIFKYKLVRKEGKVRKDLGKMTQTFVVSARSSVSSSKDNQLL